MYRAHRWTGWLIAAMAGALLLYAVNIVFEPLPSAVSAELERFTPCFVFFGAAVLCVVKGRASGPERWAWWFFALAMALWGTGALYFGLVPPDNTAAPAPYLADLFWLLFYLPAYAALYSLLRQRAGSARWSVWLDGLIGGLGVGGAGAALVFQAVLQNTEGTAVVTLTNLAYPIADLVLLALVVTAMTVTGWKASGVWRSIGAAFAIFAVADCIYLVQVANETFDPGALLDLGWPAAALLVGLSAWRPEAHVSRTAPTGATVVVPALFGCAAIALLVTDHFVPTNPLALALAAAALLVILVRFYLTHKDNERMLIHSRFEASTDALTGLGNRRQLTADLAAHVDDLDPESPLMLTLFDLDGFKHYNDTFGHLAGDKLLERLGARLSALLAGRGTAYRMGGDEFCALWNMSGVDDASATTVEAAEALSEHGEAFSIACSYGSVLLPNETADPTDALRTADRRMYARKGSRSASPGRQSSDVLLRALSERDTELGAHMDAVAELACATAMRLGVPEGDVEAVRQAALLHDVGKMAIPDEILSKPGQLDRSEWEFMKRHTVIGERIIAAAPSLAAVAKFVRSAHERYDGGGYPDGLAGHAIPLIARIVAVCDAYDAMTTDRPYREALDVAGAIAEVRRCSGTQFDPAVVEAFVRAVETAGDDAEELGTPLGHAG
jgi:diguanylate cyclase (GGDEF)-like protein/putative nucleotidyltransferase with HDIG domain